MLMLKEIYNSSSRTNVYTDSTRIKITTYFIDDKSNYSKILQKIVLPIGLDTTDINNMWNSKDPTNIVPRIMMQIFLTKPFSHYKNSINLTPIW